MVLVEQHRVAFRFFQRGQVLTLQVFDQRELHGLGLRQLADDDRHLRQSCHPAGTVSAFSGDDLIASQGQRSDKQRLQ